MTLDDFLSPAEQNEIVEAIERAETMTSGEIRLHVEPACIWGDAYARAVELFNELGMGNTRLHNGVLIYIAFNSHHIAIIGDSGINDVVPAGFWNKELATLAEYLRENRYATGICRAIESIGARLATYFPPLPDDTDEQPNEISFTANENITEK